MTHAQRTWRVLEHAEDFHRRLRAFYEALAQRQSDPRVKLLLDYFAQHQQQLEHTVRAYEERAPRQVLETWFRCFYDECRLESFEALAVPAVPMTVEQVIELAGKVNVCLEANYQRLIDSDEPPEVRTFIAELLALEVAEQKKVVRNSQQIRDL